MAGTFTDNTWSIQVQMHVHPQASTGNFEIQMHSTSRGATWYSAPDSYVKTFRGRARAHKPHRRSDWANGTCPAVAAATNKADTQPVANVTNRRSLDIDTEDSTIPLESSETHRLLACCGGWQSLACPMELLRQPQHSADFMDQLARGNQHEKHMMLLWLRKAVLQLSLTRVGCRIVQKALEVTGGGDHDMLITELKDHIAELYESPHGNYVLSKAIEVLPAAKNNFVISALHGQCATVCKHRFGCRVVCRLIEHCSGEQLGLLWAEIFAETDALARHAYGNFVIQVAFEHFAPAHRLAMLQQLLPGFAALATHRTGSLVVQKVLSNCDAEGQMQAILALVWSSQVVEIACSHYGSYVIEQIAGMRSTHLNAGSYAIEEMASILVNSLADLHASEHAERVVLAFGFPLAAPDSTAQTCA